MKKKRRNRAYPNRSMRGMGQLVLRQTRRKNPVMLAIWGVVLVGLYFVGRPLIDMFKSIGKVLSGGASAIDSTVDSIKNVVTSTIDVVTGRNTSLRKLAKAVDENDPDIKFWEPEYYENFDKTSGLSFENVTLKKAAALLEASAVSMLLLIAIKQKQFDKVKVIMNGVKSKLALSCLAMLMREQKADLALWLDNWYAKKMGKEAFMETMTRHFKLPKYI